MACTSCSSDGGAKGCKIMGLAADSCNKLTVLDWLSNMSLPNGDAPLIVLKYVSNGRKEFYRNTEINFEYGRHRCW
jgi:hypothetical protein